MTYLLLQKDSLNFTVLLSHSGVKRVNTGQTTPDILIFKIDLVPVRKSILLRLVADLAKSNATIDRIPKVNVSPGNSLFLGINFTSLSLSFILTNCAILRLKESLAPGALGRGIEKS